ncbi:tumor necrosis factor ligand superfamily member 14 [Scomber scombrus]|uniref:Tumor necrosis factor ligand superfamily member 14 n=1 Tax=Scomber scombrus TaxID=13677 RepID=A0AAV1NVW2_SCOSC|nr:tumor necrosis factor ligand superfamily member 14 [Scomber scombrus]
MAESGYPSVYVVDTHATRPPVPPRLSKVGRRAGMARTLLFILVSMALCGIIIEACFIYRLYNPESNTGSATSSKSIAEQDVTPTKSSNPVFLPSKPVAHLTDGQDAVSTKEMMAWSTVADPILYEMVYKDRSLVIQKDGYYYVYSKIFFSDNGTFHHLVNQKTKKYDGKSINLLQSRKYSENHKISIKSNSYLGGVFYLEKGDAIFVEVSDTAKVMRHKSTENFFGAYMI